MAPALGAIPGVMERLRSALGEVGSSTGSSPRISSKVLWRGLLPEYGEITGSGGVATSSREENRESEA